MSQLEVHIISSLEKVFPSQAVVSAPEYKKASVLKGENLSFQLACRVNPYKSKWEDPGRSEYRIEIESELKNFFKIRQVGYVPSMFPAYPIADNDYLKKEPGLYPDILEDYEGTFFCMPNQWRCLWFELEVDADKVQAGNYMVSILFLARKGEVIKKVTMEVEIISATLPEQELIHTEWFHSDCLADYYKVDVLSDEWWEIVKNFVSTATKRGINMILTPIFTQPLDTEFGGERTTIQLVSIKYDNHKYTFDFTNLKRWIDLCLSVGVKYFEMAHLFTQWGAEFTPKIIVEENGKEVKRFGWHVKAVSEEYKEFLNAFLPELTKKLREWGVAEQTMFHISDEPSGDQIENYKASKALVEEHLKDFKIIDALSHLDFYKDGIIKNPIPSNDVVHTFIDEGIEKLWTYYCCAQKFDVSNRFFSMPSARNRIIGLQLYKYDMGGFLHWGYNFYNSQFSKRHINPYKVTDADGAFPSGDAFLVYPGDNKEAVESIRLVVFHEALQDLRAFKLLESLTDKETVMSIIEAGVEPIKFYSYPKGAEYILSVREKVNKKIKECISQGQK